MSRFWRPVELREILSSAKEAGRWKPDGDFQEFAGEDLFLHIDGGAAIYQEYGFLRVLVQDYVGTQGRRLSLELFQMASPEGAWGMFTFKRGTKGETLQVGSGGELEEYYLTASAALLRSSRCSRRPGCSGRASAISADTSAS